MAEYVLTGKKGSGKNLYAVKMICDYLRQGRTVATNIDLYLENFFNPNSDKNYYRLPDVPTIKDLLLLPDLSGKAESEHGLIVFDECAKWLNSRDYRDPNHRKLFDWLIHSRKYGYDVVYIIQNIESLDKQIRDNFAEHLIVMSRFDRVGIPLIGPIFKAFGVNLTLPKMHYAKIYYGSVERNEQLIERVAFSGKLYYSVYNTKQIIRDDGEVKGLAQSLPVNLLPRKSSLRFYGSIFKSIIIPILLIIFIILSLGYLKSPVKALIDEDIDAEELTLEEFIPSHIIHSLGLGFVSDGAITKPVEVVSYNRDSVYFKYTDSNVINVFYLR